MDEPPIVGVHAGGGLAGSRPAGERRTHGGPRRPGRRRAPPSARSLLGAGRTPVRRRRPARTPSTPAPTVSSSIRPSGWPRPVVGRRAVRADRPTSARTRRTVPHLYEPPLDAPLTILGRARADLHVVARTSTSWASRSASRTSTPTAASHLVAKGMLNGTRRASLTDPQPLDPGVVVPLTVEVDATGWRFVRRPPDPRRRSPAPTGRTSGRRRRPRRSTVHRGPGTPSRLIAAGRPRRGPRHGAGLRARRPWSPRHASAIEPPADVDRDARRADRPRRCPTIRFETTHVTPEGTRIERDAGYTCEVDPVDPGACRRAWLAPLLEQSTTDMPSRAAPTWSSPRPRPIST